MEELPNETDVNEYKLLELSDLFQEFENNKTELESHLHQKAKNLLDNNQVEMPGKHY